MRFLCPGQEPVISPVVHDALLSNYASSTITPRTTMSSKTLVYVLDPYHADAIDLLQSTDSLDVVLPDNPAKKEWHDKAEALILRSDSRLTADDFKRAKRLRVVVKQGVGVDNIDLEAARQAGIAVHNTPALNSESVAELALGMALALARRIPELDRRMRAGEKVKRMDTLGISLFRKTVAIIGMGNIGKVAARKWIGACESTIIGYDPVAPKDAWGDIKHTRVHSLEEAITAADVITLHVPLLDSTRGMIGEKELGQMKDKAIIINAARGGVIDEKALLAELKKGRLWGAVLDAMEIEPPTKEAYGEFLELGNVVITPHIGASTLENQSISGVAVVKTLLAVLEGREDAPGKVV